MSATPNPAAGAFAPARRPSRTPATREWVQPFLAALAETSNVRRAAHKAGIPTSTAYDARRKQRAFARQWQEALCEGYDNLVLDLLCRLREGEIKPAAGSKRGMRIFDNASALRLLAAHREARERENAVQANVSAAEIRASINRKIATFRENVLADARAEAEAAHSLAAPAEGGHANDA